MSLPIRTIVLGALLAFGLGACAPETSIYTPVQSPKENKVTFIRLGHEVKFAANDTRLAPTEAERLAAFLRRSAVGYGDRVALIVPEQGNARALDARRQAVTMALANHGILTSPIGPIEGVAAAPDSVLITVGRYVVTPPACPDWSKTPGNDVANRAASNFGCANAVNLGLMVADPGDLATGRAPGPGDGDQNTLAIQRYREDKTKELLPGNVWRSGGITTDK